MKILQPLTSVLIVGLLSYTVAQEQIPNHQNLIETPPARFERPVGNRMKRSCHTNVGFSRCATSEGDHGNSLRSLREFCSDLSNLTSCERTVVDDLTTCLSQEQRRSLGIFYDISDSVLTYACEHRDATEEFLNGGGRQCLLAKYATDIQPRCANKIFDFPKFGQIEINLIGILPKLNNDNKGCTSMQNYKQCVVGVLNECSASAGDFMNDVLSYAQGKIHCSQAPPAGGLANDTLSHARAKRHSPEAPPAGGLANDEPSDALDKKGPSLQAPLAAGSSNATRSHAQDKNKPSSQAPPAGGSANATLSHAQDKKKTSQAPPAMVVNVLSIIAATVISLRFA